MLSNITEALKVEKTGQGHFRKGKLDFIVVVADIDNALQFEDIVRTFLQPETEGRRCQLLILARREPTQEIKLVINNAIYEKNLKYCIGSSMREEDLRRLQVHKAACIFIFPSTLSNLPLEDEHNILRTYAISDFVERQNYKSRVSVPIYLLSTQPSTANYVRKNASVACAETIRQSLLANTVLYSGYSTMILNLFLSSSPSRSNSSLWLSQYEDGSGNEIYGTSVTDSMDGASFTDLSWFLFVEFQVILFAVKIQISPDEINKNAEKKKDYILLNPGPRFLIKKGMICLFIAQDRASVLGVERMKFDIERLRPTSPSIFDDYTLVYGEAFCKDDSVVGKVEVSPCTKSGSKFPILTPPAPLCHLLVTPATLEEIMLESARHLKGHVRVCTNSYRLEHFISILRGKKISRGKFKTLVFLCKHAPNATEQAFLCKFPSVHIVTGDGRIRKDLMRAGFEGCESIMINNETIEAIDTIDTTTEATLWTVRLF